MIRILALVAAPFTTNLSEKLNGLLWITDSKYT
jgi:hypothetical protein